MCVDMCVESTTFGMSVGNSANDRRRDRLIPLGPDGRCDPSYPAMCIRMNEPDLDCSDVGANDFPVAAPDPHGFDTDGDGFGCVPGADTG